LIISCLVNSVLQYYNVILTDFKERVFFSLSKKIIYYDVSTYTIKHSTALNLLTNNLLMINMHVFDNGLAAYLWTNKRCNLLVNCWVL